jgi:hypothetical protein
VGVTARQRGGWGPRSRMGSGGALAPVDAVAGEEDRVGRSESTRSIWIDIDGDFLWDPHVSHVQANENGMGGHCRWFFGSEGAKLSTRKNYG